MQTIRLQVQDAAYQKIMALLSRFTPEELHVITESETHSNIQAQLEMIDSGNADFHSIEELDKKLEEHIKKH